MEYRVGQVGRVFYVRFDHGDELFTELEQVIRRENIREGWFQLFGGMAEGDVVIGPREPVMPPEPVWQKVEDTREILGMGSVFWDGDEPLVHLHAAMGHHGETLTGCVRKRAKVYLIIEAIIYEVSGMGLTRPWYEKGGFNRPTFGGE